MKKVYLNDPIAESARMRLAAKVEIVDNFDYPEELDAIIVRQQYVKRDVISRAVNCKIIQQHGTGLDRIDVEAAEEYGIPVQNTPGVSAESVAEYTVMMMLALSRKTVRIDREVRRGELSAFGLPETVGNEMSGKTLGIIGSGHIARKVAEIARSGFHMNIVCCSRHLAKKEADELGYRLVRSLEELFAMCDYVSLHNLITDETYHMINADVLSHAKPGLILINTARGGLVDEQALYDALVSGKIAAAGLDVFEQEPPDTANPLLKLDNFVAGMHVAGSTHEAMERNGKAVVDGVFRVLGIEE